jgi:hypothetical protein
MDNELRERAEQEQRQEAGKKELSQIIAAMSSATSLNELYAKGLQLISEYGLSGTEISALETAFSAAVQSNALSSKASDNPEEAQVQEVLNKCDELLLELEKFEEELEELKKRYPQFYRAAEDNQIIKEDPNSPKALAKTSELIERHKNKDAIKKEVNDTAEQYLKLQEFEKRLLDEIGKLEKSSFKNKPAIQNKLKELKVALVWCMNEKKQIEDNLHATLTTYASISRANPNFNNDQKAVQETSNSIAKGPSEAVKQEVINVNNLLLSGNGYETALDNFFDNMPLLITREKDQIDFPISQISNKDITDNGINKTHINDPAALQEAITTIAKGFSGTIKHNEVKSTKDNLIVSRDSYESGLDAFFDSMPTIIATNKPETDTQKDQRSNNTLSSVQGNNIDIIDTSITKKTDETLKNEKPYLPIIQNIETTLNKEKSNSKANPGSFTARLIEERGNSSNNSRSP